MGEGERRFGLLDGWCLTGLCLCLGLCCLFDGSARCAVE